MADNARRRERFDELFRAYGADVVAYCSWRAGRSGDPQDAVAEVFLTAWRRLDDVPRGEAARVWLYATARRVLSNQRRAGRRRLRLFERLAREAVVRPGAVELDGYGAVAAALGRLRPLDRETLLLSAWEGLEPAEIATVMGCSSATARGRLHRARKRFRLAMEEPRPADSFSLRSRPLPREGG